MKKIKSIISCILIFAMLIPNITVQALENEQNNSSEIINTETNNSENEIINNEEINDEQVNNEEINDSNTISNESEDDILQEEEEIIIDENIENISDYDIYNSQNSKIQIDYNANYMIKFTKNGNINIYSSSSLSSAYTYINGGYINDVPVISVNDKYANILVSGYNGWIDSGFTLVPVAAATNPSYYVAENGILYHYISSDLTAGQGQSGFKIMIGSAPTFMINGVRYLSYDGNYFYDGSNIANGLNNIINDLKAGNKNNSVNNNNPFYSYYQYLPFRSKTVYTANELDKFINENTNSTSKLRGLGQAFKDAEETYGVNAILALGVAINESNGGMSEKAQTKNNLFGIGAVDSNPDNAKVFDTPEDSVIDFAKEYISSGYSNTDSWKYFGGHLGNKNLGANVKYASDPFWGEKAARYAFTIDFYLSGKDISSLIDTNAYQIGMYTNTNKVVNSNGALLYNVNKIGTTFVLNNKDAVNINGLSCYEIYPDKTTTTGSTFNGVYNWGVKGYISTSGVKLINTQKNVQPLLTVLGGSTRFETAVELSKSKFDSANYVVLINRNAIFDGISATPLATAVKGPILYTEVGYLQSSTKNEIYRLAPENVIIIGGTGVVNNNVVNELKSMGVANVVRLGGATRYDTALEVAKYIDSNCYGVSEIFIVNGAADADAMSVSAVGGKNNMPILLTQTNSIPSNTYNWLKSKNLLNAYVVGGTGVVSNNVLNTLNSITRLNISNNRVGGATRQDTNALVIERFYGKNLEVVYAARSHILFDALAVGPIAALDKAPVVLINTDINETQRSVLQNKTSKRIIQAGLDFPQQGINSLRRVLKIYDL